METIELKADTFQKIINYLSHQPFNEVAELISLAVKEVKEFNVIRGK